MNHNITILILFYSQIIIPSAYVVTAKKQTVQESCQLNSEQASIELAKIHALRDALTHIHSKFNKNTTHKNALIKTYNALIKPKLLRSNSKSTHDFCMYLDQQELTIYQRFPKIQSDTHLYEKSICILHTYIQNNWNHFASIK